MSILQKSKSALRRGILERRKEMTSADVKDASARIENSLKVFLNDHSYIQTLFAFASHQNEPNLLSLVTYANSKNITFALPRIIAKNEMCFYAWNGQTPLQQNIYGILEPPQAASELIPNASTIILVPCLAADRQGHRLGYGGGFYDRYLEKYPDALTVGVVYERFLMDVLPKEPHDIRLNAVLTESKIHFFGSGN